GARRLLHPVPRQRDAARDRRAAHGLGRRRHHREPPGPVALAPRLQGQVRGVREELNVELLVPLKAADLDRLAAVLARAEALAQGRDHAADDAALAVFGEVDHIDWSVEAVRTLTSASTTESHTRPR